MYANDKVKNTTFFILPVSILVLLIMLGCEVHSTEIKKGQVCLYTGSGAELAEDVEFALNELEISFLKVDEDDIKDDNLEECSVLIIPGGYTKRAVNGLGQRGFDVIRKFVADGGGYIGICAGAYLAAQTVKVPGKPCGLGIINVENTRRRGWGMRKIYLEKHPITEGLEEEVVVHYQNGPQMVIKGKAQKIATYRNGSGAITAASYGGGKVVIFSPHPEGSITQGIRPTPDTLELLKNSIGFCKKKRANNAHRL